MGYLHGWTGCTGWGLVVERDRGLDSRLRGNDGGGSGGTVRWRRAWADGGLDSRRRGNDGWGGNDGRGLAYRDGVGYLHGWTGCTGWGLVVERDGGLDSRRRGNDGWGGNDGRGLAYRDGVGYLHGCAGCTGWGLVVEGDRGLDSRLRGNHGGGAGMTVRWRRARADGGLDSRLRGNDGVGYLHEWTGCTGWGLVVERDRGLDSRLRGNDGGGSGGTVRWRRAWAEGVWIPAGAGRTGVARE